MEASAHPIGRARRLALSPAGFRRLALASAFSLYAIVVSGALVRLTGSGLGCDSWPGCESRSFFPAENFHGTIEFANRGVSIFPVTLSLATAVFAFRTPSLPRWAAWLAAAVAAGTVAQAPLGQITIMTDLHPALVMSHFLLALAVLGGAVVLLVTAWGAGGRALARPLPQLGLLLAAATAALVTSGAFATAAGPHPGDEADIKRIGTLHDAVWVHVRVTAAFGLLLLVVVGYVAARRRAYPDLFFAVLGLLALVVTQMAVGELQYRTELPWGLVLVHVALAGAVWAGTVAFVTLLWRPLESAPEPAT